MPVFPLIMFMCLHQSPADDLKPGRRDARVSCRRMVWTQHTNSRGELRGCQAQLCGEPVAGVQPCHWAVEGGGGPQLSQEGAHP